MKDNNQILEYNELCAKFLKPNNEFRNYHFPDFGRYVNKYGNIEYEEVFSINEMEFHSDWNWIMKILKSVREVINTKLSINDFSHVRDMGLFFNPYVYSKEQVTKSIYDFLIWYDNNLTGENL